jgi:PTH1 family peptidyl-tRNA hydrolase
VPSRSRLVFGLGNPGEEYESTRHNVGFQVLDALAARGGGSFRSTRLLVGEVADATVGDVRLRLVKPHSYMNLCGPVYVRALDVFEAAPEEALVVLDDFALPFGKVRLRAEGSHGGHNGLRSIEDALASRAYPRLRLGIGPLPERADPAAWVLRRYGAEDRRALPQVLDRAADAVLAWASEGLSAAMNRYNADPD